MASGISPRGAEVISWAYTMFALATIVVVARLMVRTMMIRVVGREDVAITVALISSLLESVLMHLQVTMGGLGHHFDTLTPAQIVGFSKTAYFTIIAYNVSLCATKFSVIFLCFRIFDVARWRKAYFAVLAILGGYTVWVVINSVMPCVPIRAFWDTSVSGWCFPGFPMWILNASLNIFTDLLIVTLPIPAIMALQLPRKQKIALSLIFTLGFFVCIISILRIPSIIKAGATKDPTYENYRIAIWSAVEVNVAIIGACLATLKPLFTRLWPRLLSTIHTKSHSYRHSQGVHRTITEMHGDSIKSDAVVEPYPDYSSATSVLRGGDDVVLAEIEGKPRGVRVERADDERSEGTRERSMDGWYRPGETL